MIEQSFSSKNLISFLSPKDFYKYNLNKDNFEELVEKASNRIQQNNFVLKNIKKTIIKDISVFSVQGLEDHLALKKLNSNLIKIFKVKQSDRETIIHQIKYLLHDETPKWILKYDVEKFFENIDKDVLLNKINDNYIISHKTKLLLNGLFQSTNIVEHSGIPRGLCISGTLSELVMRDFDRAIRKFPGIYYYARYVDDIIIFSFLDPIQIEEKIETLLPKPLCFNIKKSKKYSIECKNPFLCKNRCSCELSDKDYNNFDFLGYNFHFPTIPIKNTKKFIYISIGNNKVKKIKSRIMSALIDYIKTNNYQLLLIRIKFLTGNYKLKKANNYTSNLHSGIYYNYKSINKDLKVLSDLDIFLRKSISANNNSFGRKLSGKLSPEKREELMKYSFRKGFELKITHNFTSEDIHLIKSCW